MSSNQKKYLRLTIVLFPALVFAISLTQDGFSYQYIDVERPKSYSLLLMGGIAFIGGGLFETLIWIANPIALIAIIRFLIESSAVVKTEAILKTAIPKPKPSSYWLSALAAVIAWSFSLWNEVLAAESGSMGEILSLEPGYWLWVSSFTMLTIGINYFHFQISNK
ncbi:hypothetical protein FBD94_01195 [Pedobacter hiemivivus]|uniref:Uncharacterized protein n=1 Tax=Pedobacter hiemivivus TaxID=2530454 RepID=A0A4U1GPX3_9SPHI|nr:hypothetical protein [Pedobacter hiemivivus]TKC65203.1 hypothetical protein FBD94_01195 [Pedobacter hiemivivus]